MSDVIVCGRGAGDVRETPDSPRHEGHPDGTGHRLLIAYATSAYYSPTIRCECGDQWADGEMFARPFRRGWRQAAQAEFVERWETARPVGTRPIYSDDAMLTGWRTSTQGDTP